MHKIRNILIWASALDIGKKIALGRRSVIGKVTSSLLPFSTFLHSWSPLMKLVEVNGKWIVLWDLGDMGVFVLKLLQATWPGSYIGVDHNPSFIMLWWCKQLGWLNEKMSCLSKYQVRYFPSKLCLIHGSKVEIEGVRGYENGVRGWPSKGKTCK